MADTVFKIINPNVVRRLQDEGDIELPKKKLDIPKDQRWNTKQMSAILLKGLQNGDSVDKIADSLKEVIGNNDASAIRNARTMVTGAENKGRIDSYKNLEDQGAVLKKVWIATPDNRTRDSHLALDGEEVDINDTFSNGLEYPGDPSGDASEVWNCRCSMRSHVVGFKKADGSVRKIDVERDSTMHEEQMEKEREHRAKEEKKEYKVQPIDRVVHWGFHGKDDATDEEANNMLELAGIDMMEGDITADIRMIDNRNRVKVHDDEREVELIVYEEKKEVYIDLIAVEKKGKGEGTKLLEEIKRQAEEQGYSKLTAYAAGDYMTVVKGHGYNGYYSLARFGFDGDIAPSLKEEAYKKFKARTVQDLMKTEESRKWWKNNGTGFEAVLELKKKKR